MSEDPGLGGLYVYGVKGGGCSILGCDTRVEWLVE